MRGPVWASRHTPSPGKGGGGLGLTISCAIMMKRASTVIVDALEKIIKEAAAKATAVEWRLAWSMAEI